MQYDKARLQTFKKHRHTLMMPCYRWSNTPSFISKCCELVLGLISWSNLCILTSPVQSALTHSFCSLHVLKYSQMNFQRLCNSLTNCCVWYSAWFPPCFSDKHYDHTEKSVSVEGEVLLKMLLAVACCFFPTFFQTIGSCLCSEFGQRTKATVFCSKNMLHLLFIHSFFKMYSLLLLLYYLLQKLKFLII